MARQFGGLAAGRGIAGAFAFLWLAIAARELTLSEFADLALVLSVVLMMSVIADFGLPLVLNEVVAAEPSRGRATLIAVMARRTGLAVVAAIGMAGLYLLAAGDSSPAIPAAFAVSIVATAWHTSASAALRGRRVRWSRGSQ